MLPKTRFYPLTFRLIRLMSVLILTCGVLTLVSVVGGQSIPDPTIISFSSQRSGSAKLYLMDIPHNLTLKLTRGAANQCCHAWSPDGRYLAYEAQQGNSGSIQVMTMDGRTTRPLNLSTGNDRAPSWSPDGKRIAFTSYQDNNWGIYLADVEDDLAQVRRIEGVIPAANRVSWSPDSSQLALVVGRGVQQEIFVINADGGDLHQITRNARFDSAPAWSPDGCCLAFTSIVDAGWELFVVDTSTGEQRRLTQNKVFDTSPAWSPDGRYLAYMSNPFGNWDIFILDMTQPNTPAQRLTTSEADDFAPVWMPILHGVE